MTIVERINRRIMSTLELPKSFDEFVDARKAGFMRVKEYVENGGHLVNVIKLRWQIKTSVLEIILGSFIL